MSISLRPTSRSKILNTLDRTIFTSRGYQVDFNEEGKVKNGLFEIFFLQDKSLHISLYRSDIYNKKWYTVEMPGEHVTAPERFDCESLEDVLTRIRLWSDRIISDYKSSRPIYDAFEEFRSDVYDRITKIEGENRVFFTRDEASSLIHRLNDVYSKFNDLQESNKITKDQLNSITNELTELKDSIEYLPRGVWYRAATNKVLGYLGRFSNSTEGRELVSSAVKGLLTGGEEAP